MVPLIGTSRVIAIESADPTGQKDCPPLAPAPDDPPLWPSTAGSGTTPAAAPRLASLPWAQVGGAINDASCLDRTAVHGVVQVTDEQHVRAALTFARSNGLKVAGPAAWRDGGEHHTAVAGEGLEAHAAVKERENSLGERPVAGESNHRPSAVDHSNQAGLRYE